MMTRTIRVAMTVALCVLGLSASAVTVEWNGARPSDSWSDGANWNGGSAPDPTEAALFTNAGSSTIPNEVTSVLMADRTIGGLLFSNSTGKYHTLDLSGSTLRVEGDLSFNVNNSGQTTTILRNGRLDVDSPFGYVNVGRAFTGSGWAEVDLGTLSEFNAEVHEFHVGTRTGSSAYGGLTLAQQNAIDATRVIVGNNATGRLHLGQTNTILADEMTVGMNIGSSLLDVINGGTLTLGSPDQRMALSVGEGIWNTNSTYHVRFDMTGGTLNAHLDNLTLGEKDNRSGSYDVTFLAGDQGSISIGASGNTARMVVGGTRSVALADFSGLESFSANLNQMLLGVGGSSRGTVKLAETANIDARRILVGDGSTATLTLGNDTTIVVDDFDVGANYSTGTVDVPNGGTLALGTPERPTNLSIGKGTWDSNVTRYCKLDLTGATLVAHLDNLVVGRKDNRSGYYNASLAGAVDGSVALGRPDDPGRMIVAGERGTGLVDFSGLDSFTAHLDKMLLGAAPNANATVKLAEVNAIAAEQIVVGDRSPAVLELGQENTVETGELRIGANYSTSTVTVPNGGTLNLGTPENRTALYVSQGPWSKDTTRYGKLDLTDATLNAHLDHLIVGEKDNQSGYYNASVIVGRGGTVSLGDPAKPARVLVGGARSTGLVDFTGLDDFTAHVSQMLLGVGGNSNGTMKLADTNVIDAERIVVGDGSPGKMTLGRENTILADELHIGKNYSTSTVDIRPGGTLNLGSPERRTHLTIANGIWNSNTTRYGMLDLSEGTVVAYLDRVVIGQKDNQTGNHDGTLRLSDSANNYVDAESIRLGGPRATGTLDFAGGTLRAGSIEKGTGTARFNWTGGTLHVDRFGTPAHPLDLANTGTGILSPGYPSAGSSLPGDPIGTTQIFGDYRQGFAATLQIDLDSPTAFDRLLVHEQLSLDGTLLINVPPGGLSGEFPIAEYGTLTGRFDEVLAPGLVPGHFSLDYGSGANDTITLVTAPEPSVLVLAALGLAGAGIWLRRKRRTS